MIQKLIDAYELEREMYRKCIDTDEEIEKGRAKWDSGLWIRYKVFEDTIILAPRVDPVKHGKWMKVEDDYNNHLYECSYCHTWTSLPNEEVDDRNIRYCWSCGARMDEVGDETN